MMIAGNVNGRQMQTTADGEAVIHRSPEEVKNDQESQKKKKNLIYAGDLHLNQVEDKVAEERRKAREIAKQLVDGVKQKNAEELKEMDDRIAHAEELRELSKGTDRMIADISKELAELKKDGDPADEETAKRIEELEIGLKEYMEQGRLEKEEMYSEYAVVRGMKIEQLKHHDMIDAKKQGEEITEAAEKNVIGILMEETKDKIDQDMEDSKEKAEEKKAEEELQKAQIEAAREERRAENDKMREETEDLLELQQSQQEIQQQQSGDNLPDMKKSMEQVVGELKLAAEDLKGLLVDKEI